MKNAKIVYQSLDRLYDRSKREPLDNDSRWVIFSDLHMGDGSSSDDFLPNAQLFHTAARNYYLKNDFSLILNGDIEELQRYTWTKIYRQWKKTFELFEDFANKTQLVKTIGNHDLKLGVTEPLPYDYFLTEGFRLGYGENDLFVFHGHQASKKYQQRNEWVGFTLKYFANPLGIKNYSVSHSSTKQFKIEKRVYRYSTHNKRISIIGHTHRPLFESQHKGDRLKHMIEELCRKLSQNETENIAEIITSIKSYKKELQAHYRKDGQNSFKSYVYDAVFNIPCVFNSGSVIGKRGMTCLEIEKGEIRLVHWFNKHISPKYLQRTGYEPRQLDKTEFYRMVINQETLDYIFARINYLT
ncbi:MAG: hypothetical protein JXQ90_17360 [Cyclobacteriaceae bacterium]